MRPPCCQHSLMLTIAHLGQAAAVNGLSDRISVVNRDVALLERGHEAPRTGVNLVVADMFDAGAVHATSPMTLVAPLSLHLQQTAAQPSHTCMQHLPSAASAAPEAYLHAQA